ncbi:MCE family protein [Nocardioides carbamazepini]|uniref:MlaD family protein n=1 Tax=Nocardioides carbamazepini TaxID=2854259 RepID=UPI00214A8889|nr:MlaD family protein [Nocardioides carbamazepini]MCR1786509.1 MCE family protein [Nocardioides carbamazepini]
MLNITAKAKLFVFMALAMVTTTFLAAQYVGLDRYVGGYRITVELSEAGGLFDNSEVTYRGVPVGRVESLVATDDGARAVVRIKPGSPDMPADVEARVVNRSAIGEQYLDLRGGPLGGDKLGEGDRLTVGANGLPPSLDGLLRSGRDFVASVPSDALTTVIDETYDLSRGNGQHMARLVETSSEFARSADKHFLVSASLIRSSGTVLATQEAAAESFQSFSKDMSLLAHALAEQNESWRQLIEQTPAAARELGVLFKTVGEPLGDLMGNLVSTAQVFGTNAAGVKETLIKLPEGISITYAVMTAKGLRMGVTPTFFNPLPCVTGYGATELRPGLDVSPGKPFNTDAGCTAPAAGGNVRGPGAVPKGKRPVGVDMTGSLEDLMGGTP